MKNKKDEFIKSAVEKFGDYYDLSKIPEIITNYEKDIVTIICPEHGEFTTTPKSFLKSKFGCKKCSYLKRSRPLNTLNTTSSSEPNLNLIKEYIISSPISTDKNHLIGYVYCFINNINNKVYIGETVKHSYEERFSEHRRKALNGIKTYFYNALRKYSWDGFSRYIIYQTDILEYSEENKKKLNDVVNEKEKYFITLFKSNNSEFGYNLTFGGDGIVGYKFSEEVKQHLSEIHSKEKHWKYGTTNIGGKAVYQFDLDFNFIREWESAAEIGRTLGYRPNNISKCCSNEIDSYMNFIWVRKSDYFEGYLQKYKSRAKCKSNDKAVLQYDFLGNFIAEYISCAEAGRALNKKNVGKAASGQEPQMYNFIWIYKNEFTENLLKEKVERVKSCRFYNKVVKELKLQTNE